MLSKFLRAPFLKSAQKTITKGSRFFASETSSVSLASEQQAADLRPGPSVHDIKQRPKLLDIAHLAYKKYPNVSHNDPESADYIPSERDEYHDRAKVVAYNKVVDGIKNDVKMQEEVYRIVEQLDRDYKQGEPGNTKNISNAVDTYFPPGDLGFKPFEEDHYSKFFSKHYSNLNRWTDQTVYYPKYAPIRSDLEWQKEVENRPVNKHFHHDKGYKYDVEVPWDQRYPHVADRMGYPEILGTPFERLMRLEGDIYHPTFLDQPFVQIPSSDPNPSLNFEEGEVVYENTQLLEWAKFFNLTGFSLYAFGALFIPYNFLYKTHLPTTSGYEGIFVPYYQHTMFYFDNLGLHIPTIGFIAMYATYLAIAATHRVWKDYVIKMQYSKDKELLFVTRISPYCSVEEEVYEVHHLECLPPSVKTAMPDLSSQDKDGLWDITCTASHRNLVVYNEDKYWNPALRKGFFDQVMNYWTPDLVQPSRLEKINDAINSPKIVLGAEKAQIEEK